MDKKEQGNVDKKEPIKEEVKEAPKSKDSIEIPVGKYLDMARDNPWRVSTVVLGVFLFAVLIMNIGAGGAGPQINVLDDVQLSDRVVSFVESRTGERPEVVSINSDGPFVEVILSLQGQEVPIYITTDGEYRLPGEPMLLSGEVPAAVDSAGEKPSTSPPAAPKTIKSDKPNVELFVMSHCPFGTQMEKGIIPVVQLLGDNIDFEFKTVYYAMHGEVEITEEIGQYCIQKEQNNKFLDYLTCFLEDGNTDRCLTEVKIDTKKLDACAKATDEEFGIMDSFADRGTWLSGRYPLFDIHKADNEKYGVGGSPTLVINGEQVSSARDSASLLRAICGAFNDAPAECDETLSSASPSSGFGYGTSGGSAPAANCGV